MEDKFLKSLEELIASLTVQDKQIRQIDEDKAPVAFVYPHDARINNVVNGTSCRAKSS